MSNGADDEPQTCAALDEPAYGVWFECELPPGHVGDHQGTWAWPNEPHGPARPPRPVPSFMSLAAAHAQMATQQIEFALKGSPFIDREKILFGRRAR